jgi:transposase-like protein
VDQDDDVLDILVQSRCNKKVAKKFFKKLLKGLQYMPRVVITDKLKSYGAAKRAILAGVETDKADISITDVRTHTDRRASVSGTCSGSSQPATPSVFWLRMVPSANTSDPGDICCRRWGLVKRCGNDSSVGPL